MGGGGGGGGGLVVEPKFFLFLRSEQVNEFFNF